MKTTISHHDIELLINAIKSLNQISTSQDMKMLIKTVKGLKHESNIWKEIILPITMVFVSAFSGAYASYLFLRYQEKAKIEKEKIQSVNKWTLALISAQLTLYGIKSEYYDKLTSHPLQRMSIISNLIFTTAPIKESIVDLSFMVPSETDKPSYWSLLRIKAVTENYNNLLSVWITRNELTSSIKKEMLKTRPGKAASAFTIQDYQSVIDASKLAQAIHLNEKVIQLTDNLLIDITKFLLEFPKEAEVKINKNLLKNYGVTIFKCQSTQAQEKIQDRTPAPDHTLLAQFLEQSVEEIQKEFS